MKKILIIIFIFTAFFRFQAEIIKISLLKNRFEFKFYRDIFNPVIKKKKKVIKKIVKKEPEKDQRDAMLDEYLKILKYKGNCKFGKKEFFIIEGKSGEIYLENNVKDSYEDIELIIKDKKELVIYYKGKKRTKVLKIK